MKQARFAASALTLWLIIGLTSQVYALTPTITPTPAPALTPTSTIAVVNETIYTVQPGETLFRIALRFNVTVRQIAELNGITNPSLIFAGQKLRIPSRAGTPATATATTGAPATSTLILTPATPLPPTSTYSVQRGDTLYRIAIRFKTTISRLASLNPQITDTNIIFVGQTLRVPGEGLAPLMLTATPTPTQQGAASSGQGGGTTSGYGFAYGIEVFMTGQIIADVTTSVNTLGMQWVKQTVYWRDIEPVRGQIDFTALDEVVNTLTSSNLNILFTVTAAPTWARTYILENGPPDNVADFGAFISALVQRYSGRVQAYEIWNEPNRRSEWSCTEDPQNPRFCTTRYIDLLTAAYQSVKQSDGNALVISAGLAPTGYNDGTNAVDDRQFLADTYRAGLAGVSDGVGVHPLGWANPPDSACCTTSDGVLTHFEKPSFYFRNTLDDYRQIIVNAGDGSTAIWITKFGWGTSEDTTPPSENDVYVSYTSLEQQATYIPRAFALGAELGFIGPMFLDNLNGCQAAGDIESCYYSLLGPNGQSRPAYERLRAIISANDALPESPATSTPEMLLPIEPTATLAQQVETPEATAEG